MFGASPPGPPPNQAERNATPTYDFPGQKIVLHYLTDMPIRTSALRTLGAYSNVFALESFFDEAASAAGADPVEYRLRHMKDPRARGDRGMRVPGRLEARREERRHAWPRLRLLAIQERGVLRGAGPRRRGRPPHRQGARD